MKATLRRIALAFINRVRPPVDPLIEARRLARWLAAGSPHPMPPIVKHAVLERFAAEHGLRTLIETGTRRGDTLAALYGKFDALHSIELLPDVYEAAHQRFRASPKIHLYLGDSAVLLAQLIAELRQPALFWIDAHSPPGQPRPGETVTPILIELEHIFAAPFLGHVIIVDDAHLFMPDVCEQNGYPVLSDVLARIERDGRWDAKIELNSIRITPKAATVHKH